MTAETRSIHIHSDGEDIAGTLLSPETSVPGVLFVHGWGGSQQRDLARANKLAGLGCICLTFDLRGHEKTLAQQHTVTREHNLADVLAAYDHLIAQPSIDRESIAVIGTSYGGYLATLLTSLRPVRWLALRVPALYWDEEWTEPKQTLNRERLQDYRRRSLSSADNQALQACSEFQGDVLLVESEHDDFVPHATIMNYRAAFFQAHSMTHRIIDGADHALSTDEAQTAYTSHLSKWVTEMIIGSRTGQQ
ncbi:alpha/beta hydrolase family protein [Halopseudomonas pelagia]|uniref:Alpha/beta fold hydrolase n=1 Tax=Halopseudomonas pelagia TaxID=553151 RepID=A0AA91U3F2_9GAMM|nr:alpha/beta fold hydrolase [Halopseudomonas pelagia]PCC99869.1 alpha/beta hydrolase [Halopseudomonas pelagia]QFY56269.1 alpha/beta fold hydrolase [Halopseudomonas pelagia]